MLLVAYGIAGKHARLDDFSPEVTTRLISNSNAVYRSDGTLFWPQDKQSKHKHKYSTHSVVKSLGVHALNRK